MFHFFVLRSVTSYSGTCLRALLIGRWDSWSSCKVAMLWHATSIQPGVCLGKKTLLLLTLTVQGWDKGVVFINGFNLGRYWNVGPQRTLFVPAPLLQLGPNQVVLCYLWRMCTFA